MSYEERLKQISNACSFWQKILNRFYGTGDEARLIERMSLDDLIISVCALNHSRLEIRPRHVIFSSRFNRMNPSLLKITSKVAEECQEGCDLNARLSKRKPALSSNVRSSPSDKFDQLLAGYGIYHLHLGSGPKKRSKELLFTCFKADSCFFIDVETRHKFRPRLLLDVVLKEAPMFCGYKFVEGASGLNRTIDDNEVEKALYVNPRNFPVEAGGGVLLSDNLVSTNGTPLKVVRQADQIRGFLEEVNSLGLEQQISFELSIRGGKLCIFAKGEIYYETKFNLAAI